MWTDITVSTGGEAAQAHVRVVHDACVLHSLVLTRSVDRVDGEVVRSQRPHHPWNMCSETCLNFYFSGGSTQTNFGVRPLYLGPISFLFMQFSVIFGLSTLLWIFWGCRSILIEAWWKLALWQSLQNLKSWIPELPAGFTIQLLNLFERNFIYLSLKEYPEYTLYFAESIGSE